jgi:hypothetical protein
LPSVGNNAIEDFVLFPEEDAFPWTQADLSIPDFDETLDLSHFNVDISGFNNHFNMIDTSYDFIHQTGVESNRTSGPNDSDSFGSFQPISGIEPDHATALHDLDQYSPYQWASAQGCDAVSHSRPHHAISSYDPGQVDSNWFDHDLLSNDSPGVCSFSESESQSVRSSEQLGRASSPNIEVDDSQLIKLYPRPSQASLCTAETDNSQLLRSSEQLSPVMPPSSEVDWTTLESSSLVAGEEPSPLMKRKERCHIRSGAAEHPLTGQEPLQEPSATLSYRGSSVFQDEANGFGTAAITTIGTQQRYQIVTKPTIERLSRLVDAEVIGAANLLSVPAFANAFAREEALALAQALDSPSVNLSRILSTPVRLLQTPVPNPLQAISGIEASPHNLIDQDHALALSAQNVESSGSESLSRDSELAARGAILRTILDLATWSYGSKRTTFVLENVISFLLMVASMILLTVWTPPQ